MNIIRYTDLTSSQHGTLETFVKQHPCALPYHLPGFVRVMDGVFRYPNLSLVALNDAGEVVGFVPQWKKGSVIESVPWRDKGGPLCAKQDVRADLLKRSLELMAQYGANGILWRGCCCDGMEQRASLVNVSVECSDFDKETYWRSLPSKARRWPVRAARKSGVEVREATADPRSVERFYQLLVMTRKRLGVPVYKEGLFISLYQFMSQDSLRIYEAYKDGMLLSSIVLLQTPYVAVEAYAASDKRAFRWKANDLLLYEVINHCIEQNIRLFDFGADSPFQKSLTDYKMRWVGVRRVLIDSYCGKVDWMDHNHPRYNPVKHVIRHMPGPVYRSFSNWVVR